MGRDGGQGGIETSPGERAARAMTVADLLRPDARIEAHRARWRNRGAVRPPFATEPAEGEESVWDYPRPPCIVSETRAVEVRHEGRTIAASMAAVRVLETASPPTLYLPPADVRAEWLVDSGARSFCEWKGEAVDLDLVDGPCSAAWCYPRVFPEFASIAGWYSFYPGRVECTLGGERVRPQPGGYYGGWITDEIVGPVKGEPGVVDP